MAYKKYGKEFIDSVLLDNIKLICVKRKGRIQTENSVNREFYYRISSVLRVGNELYSNSVEHYVAASRPHHFVMIQDRYKMSFSKMKLRKKSETWFGWTVAVLRSSSVYNMEKTSSKKKERFTTLMTVTLIFICLLYTHEKPIKTLKVSYRIGFWLLCIVSKVTKICKQQLFHFTYNTLEVETVFLCVPNILPGGDSVLILNRTYIQAFSNEISNANRKLYLLRKQTLLCSWSYNIIMRCNDSSERFLIKTMLSLN